MENIEFCPNILKNIEIIRTAIQMHIEEVGKDPSEEKRLELNSTFSSILKKQASKIYSLLNYSVLAGEYVVNENLADVLDNITENVSSLIECFPEKEYKLEAENLYDVNKNIVNDIKRYKSIIVVFWKAIENPYKNLLSLRDSLKDADNSVFMDIKDYSEVFKINLSLMFIDSNYSLSNGIYYELNLMKQRLQILNKNIQEPFVDAIHEKIQLLVCKFRYKSDHKRQESSYYVTDGVVESVNINELPDNDLAVQIGKINTRDRSPYEYNIRQYFEKIQEPKSTFDFFVLCHYYKNVVPNSTLLQKVEDDFRSFAANESSKFSIANSKVCENYFRNCRLSFLLKQEETTYKKVKAELENIHTLQIATQYDDHFPYYKVAEWELNKLKECLTNLEKVDFLEILLKDAKENLDTARKFLGSTKHNDGCFIPYRPFFNDCIAHIKIKDDLLKEDSLPLFCLSSFVLPVDYEKEYGIVEELETEYSKLSASVEACKTVKRIYSEYKDSNNQISKKIESLKQTSQNNSNELKKQVTADLKENQRTVIEILSVFAAIVIFASGSIQILSKSSDVLIAGKYMLLFSAGLGVMGLLLSCIFRRNSKWDGRDIFSLCFCGLILLLSCVGIFCSHQNNTSASDIKQVVEQEIQKYQKSSEPLNIDATISIKEEKIEPQKTLKKK